MTEIALIVAVAENGVIGRNGGLPWRMRSDLKLFRQKTMGKPVVMGRKTFESLSGPLDGRYLIVLSKEGGRWVCSPYDVYPQLDWREAVELAEASANKSLADEIMVAGGASVYELALPYASRIYMSAIHATVEGDTHFPLFDPEAWREVSRVYHRRAKGDDYDWSEIVWERLADPLPH